MNESTEADTIVHTAAARRHACAVCQQDWPENAMIAVAGRWMCGLCRERALGDLIPAGEKRFRMSSYVPDYTKWIVALTILAVVLRLSVAMWMRHASSRPMPQKPRPIPAEEEKAPPKKKLLDA